MKRSPFWQFKFRLNILFSGLILIGFVLIANLFYIQIRLGERFRRQADNQYVVASYNIFERGTIYFEEKDGDKLSAAGQRVGYKVSVNPSTLEDPQGVYEALNSVRPLDPVIFDIAVGKKNRSYAEVMHEVTQEEASEIRRLLGRQVQLHDEKWRVYPLAGTAAHVLGFLGYQGDDYAGRYGLERSYEDTLKREDTDLYTNFFARVFHDAKRLKDEDYVPEGNLVSSIEPQVQIFFENELEAIQDHWNSASSGGVIMNPQNGEIYAMAAFPSYDNNDISQYSLADFKNPLVENVYEMGSIIKPLVVAIGLDTKVINEHTEYYDQGYVEVGQHTIYNFDKKGRGQVDVQEILNQSLNTGMVFISTKIARDDFREYFKNYGFGELTGIDLPNEAKGLTSNLSSNRQIEFANMSFGQGIAISPIAVTKAISALAHDGVPVTPHVVKKIEYTNGFSKTLEYEAGKRVMSSESSDEISRMLVNVFDGYNNGQTKLPNYSVAAKTGTAQIPDPSGGYYTDRNLHSFFGYFPAYDPEFLVFLYTVHPKGVRYASQTLIGPFRNTANFLINYYNVQPDR